MTHYHTVSPHLGICSDPFSTYEEAEEIASFVAWLRHKPPFPIVECTDVLCEASAVVRDADDRSTFDRWMTMADTEIEAELDQRWREALGQE